MDTRPRTYTDSILLRSRDVDPFGRWRSEAILSAMEEAGETHADLLRVGRFQLEPLGIAWIVVRTALKMERYPRLYDRVEVTTWPGVTQHFFFPRYYEFRTPQGEVLGQACTVWMLMDLKARKALPSGALPTPMPDTADLPTPLKTQPKLRFPRELAWRETALTAAYHDLDVNRHVNNTRYAAWLNDGLGFAYHETHQLESLEIHYQAEILPETRVILATAWQGNTLCCRALKGESVLFQAQGTFIPVQSERSML